MVAAAEAAVRARLLRAAATTRRSSTAPRTGGMPLSRSAGKLRQPQCHQHFRPTAAATVSAQGHHRPHHRQGPRPPQAQRTTGARSAPGLGAPGRLLDFFATDAPQDARQVALEGHSRYGKATMVAMVYEPRVANGFVSSSGEGGAKLWRHLVGQQVESLANAEYYWMAGNIIKYGGPLTVDDLPVDQHQFIALVAPRPIFISGGEYIEGNGKPGTNSRYSGEDWQDTPGTFMATAGASPVWKLLGKQPLGNKALHLSFDEVPDPMAIEAKNATAAHAAHRWRRRLPRARAGSYRCPELAHVHRVRGPLFPTLRQK